MKHDRLRELLFALMLMLMACLDAGAGMKKEMFGKLSDGREVSLYTLDNGKGMQVAITNFGGAVVALKIADRTGKFGDVVLGYENLQGYVTDKASLGALIGRYANRIAHGKFVLRGVTYSLPINNGENTLHGGPEGFSKRLWDAKDVSSNGLPALQLTYPERGWRTRLSRQPGRESCLLTHGSERAGDPIFRDH